MARPRKTSLLIIFVTVFIDLLGFAIVLPLLPRYGKYFEANAITLGLLMASFSAMQFIFAPIWGRVSDRIGRRPILILGLAGSTLFYGLFGFASNLGTAGEVLGLSALAWLFVARIGAGIAGATIPTAQAYIADVTGPKDRAKGMALIGAAFGIGFTFGPLLGAAFVSSDPLAAPSPLPGYVAAALSGIALLSAIFVLPESLNPESTPVEHHWFDVGSFRQALARPSIGLILLTMFLSTFAFAQFETTLSLLTKDLNISQRYNFLVFAYIGLVLTISQGVLVRRFVPIIGEFRMCLFGCLLMTIGLALIGVAGLVRSILVLYIVLPVCVVGFSAMIPSLQALLSLRSSEAAQGEILGLGQSVSALARILGPVAGILLFYRAATYPYWMAAALMAVGIVLVLALRSQPPLETDKAALAAAD